MFLKKLLTSAIGQVLRTSINGDQCVQSQNKLDTDKCKCSALALDNILKIGLHLMGQQSHLPYL